MGLLSLHMLIYLNLVCCGAFSQAESQTQCSPSTTKKHTELSRPPSLGGSWYSPSCEIQPGPQFVLRHYQFSKSSKDFSIIRYYYSDEFCKEPAYSIKGEGTISPGTPSWYLSEATDADVQLTKLTVTPYKADVAVVLGGFIHQGCQGFSEVKDVFSYQSSLELNASDYTCLQSLSFSVNELLVVRQVNYYKRKGTYNVIDSTKTAESLGTGRRSRHRKSRRQLSLAGRELFLGNGVWFSQLDRPSSYQLPLYSYEHKDCEACSCIDKASVDNPPMECDGGHQYSGSARVNLTGHWSSAACESVPYSLFTLRSLDFNEVDGTYSIKTTYYTDNYCTLPSFTLTATGYLVSEKSFARLQSTRSYQLIFSKLSVGVLSETMAELLSMGDTSRCGHVTNWQLGEMHDVTNTGGCDALNIAIRDSQYTLIKSGIDSSNSEYMIMSEMKSMESAFDTEVTHFTPKLIKCKAEIISYASFKTQKLTQSFSSQASTHSMSGFLILGVMSLLQ